MLRKDKIRKRFDKVLSVDNDADSTIVTLYQDFSSSLLESTLAAFSEESCDKITNNKQASIDK